jgi:glycosyltransferase involved in cell wall biosynthesis
MAERVEDGVNGLHFQVGNAQDLAEKIMRVINEPTLHDEFIAKIPHVKTIQENARELEDLYTTYLKKKLH